MSEQSLPEYDWLLCGCHGEVTADLSLYRADYFACCVVAAASVWQSALGREQRRKQKWTPELFFPSAFFSKDLIEDNVLVQWFILQVVKTKMIENEK